MSTHTGPSVCRQSLEDGRCPFCGGEVIDAGANALGVVFDGDGEIHEDQACSACGAAYRVYYGPVGVVRGDEYLPAIDASTSHVAGRAESEVRP